MIDLLNLFRARGAATISLEAPVFEKFRPSLPDREPPSPPLAPLKEPPLGRALAIDYVDADGLESKRRITVHAVMTGASGIYLQSYCHERKEPRCFRGDRIRSLIDRETGEVIDAPEAIHSRIAAMAATDAALSATLKAFVTNRAGILTLLFLARCDGERPSETDVILNFIDYAADGAIDEDCARRKLAGLHPDPVAFDLSIEHLARKPDNFRRVAKAATRLIEADGVITEEEALFADELSEVLRKM